LIAAIGGGSGGNDFLLKLLGISILLFGVL
jgi:hypothetical protein